MKINKDNALIRKVSTFSSILSITSFLIVILISISLCACYNDVSEDITPAQPIEQAIYQIEIIADNVVETYGDEDSDYEPLPEEYNSNSSGYLYDKNKVDELIAQSDKYVDEANQLIEEANQYMEEINKIIEDTNKLVESYHIDLSAYGL